MLNKTGEQNIKMKCSYKKGNGQLCGSHPMHGNDSCWFHSPDVSDAERTAARFRGGRNNAVKTIEPLPQLADASPKSVLILLLQVINEVRNGQIDIRIANCVGFLSGHLVHIYELSELDARLSTVEKAVKDRKTKGK